MALKDHKITSFSKPVSALADTPAMSAQELKEWFDSNTSNEVKEKHNALIDELEGEIAAKADISSLHTHENKAVLDSITKAPVTHEELNVTETNACDFAVSLNDKTNEKFSDYPTKDEAQLMCDMAYNTLNESKIGEAPKDGKAYGRKNGLWTEIIMESGKGVEEIDYKDIDAYMKTGIAVVNEVNEVLSGENWGMRHFNKHLLICSADYDIYDGSGDGSFMPDSDYRYTQTLILADGSIKKRRYEHYVWSEWEEVSVSADYVDKKIGDIDAALDGIIAKYGLGGDA